MGVNSYGRPINEPNYVKVISAKKCRLQPGYEAVRRIKLNDGKLHESNSGVLFKACTKSESLAEYSSATISTVVSNILHLLNIQTNKKVVRIRIFWIK